MVGRIETEIEVERESVGLCQLVPPCGFLGIAEVGEVNTTTTEPGSVVVKNETIVVQGLKNSGVGVMA